jgi:hypothetical protein
MAAAATRMAAAAATRTGTAHISHLRGRVDLREVITRMVRRITAVVVAAAALMMRHRVLIRRRAAVILRPHGHTQRHLLVPIRRHRVIPRRRGRIQHRPRRLALTPPLAAVMEAEVGVAEAAAGADRTVVVAAPRTVAEVTREAAEDRTATK